MNAALRPALSGLRLFKLKAHWGRYYYILDPDLGLMQTRAENFFPVAIHVCVNGHE